MSGMGQVKLHLSKTGGDISSYLEHFSFLSRQAGAHRFLDSAYVFYDRHVVDQYINGYSDKFVSGDLFSVALHFHAGNLAPALTKLSVTRGFRGRGYAYIKEVVVNPGVMVIVTRIRTKITTVRILVWMVSQRSFVITTTIVAAMGNAPNHTYVDYVVVHTRRHPASVLQKNEMTLGSSPIKRIVTSSRRIVLCLMNVCNQCALNNLQ